MEFIISIDTEADNQWEYGNSLTAENLQYVPRFQDLCEKYDIRPTYLVTSEVCEDPYGRQIFSDYWRSNRAEIGAHLHLWTTPPFLDKDGYRFNDPNHGFANEIPLDMAGEKLRNLTEQIKSAFGNRPTSFRSGRYGFNEGIAGKLAENGYIVDSSVTPLLSWKAYEGIPGGEGGPDFIDYSCWPYYYKFPDASLLEIPVTVLATRFPLNRNARLSAYFFRNVDRKFSLKIIRRLFQRDQPLWFRPNPWITMDHIREIIGEAERINLPFIVMMFHSSELMPGCSIYRPDKDSIERLYKLLEDLFRYLKTKDIGSVTLTETSKKISL